MGSNLSLFLLLDGRLPLPKGTKKEERISSKRLQEVKVTMGCATGTRETKAWNAVVQRSGVGYKKNSGMFGISAHISLLSEMSWQSWANKNKSHCQTSREDEFIPA